MATASIYISLEVTRGLAEALAGQLTDRPEGYAHSYATGLCEALESYSNVGPGVGVPRIECNRVKQIFQEGLAQGDIEGLRRTASKLVGLVNINAVTPLPNELNFLALSYI